MEITNKGQEHLIVALNSEKRYQGLTKSERNEFSNRTSSFQSVSKTNDDS